MCGAGEIVGGLALAVFEGHGRTDKIQKDAILSLIGVDTDSNQ
jgi:hypothetical protein